MSVTYEELNLRLEDIRAEFRAEVDAARAKFDAKMQALADELGVKLPRAYPSTGADAP